MSDNLPHHDSALWDSIAAIATPISNNKVPYKKSKATNRDPHHSILSYDKCVSDYISPIHTNLTRDSNKHNISSGLNLDYNTKKKVDKGKYRIDNVLDLHGYTLNTAYNALTNFIIKNYNLGNKCLLIITGWNSTNKHNNNSIKGNFGKWLQSENICETILYYRQAIHSYGGKGAFYVLLKSKNKKT
ncbi:MAG: Smr/MutS family protein [Ehrlichia sp.]